MNCSIRVTISLRPDGERSWSSGIRVARRGLNQDGLRRHAGTIGLTGRAGFGYPWLTRRVAVRPAPSEKGKSPERRRHAIDLMALAATAVLLTVLTLAYSVWMHGRYGQTLGDWRWA